MSIKRFPKKTFILAGACAALLAATLAWYAHKPTNQPRGLLALGPGIHAYDLSLETRVKSKVGSVAQFSLKGIFQVQRRDEHDGITEFVTNVDQAALTSVLASEEGREQMRAATREFARPLVLRVDREGRIVDVKEDATTRSQVRTIMKAIAAMSQFVQPSSVGSAWKTQESDTAGEYAAAYSETSRQQVQKSKTAYTNISGLANAAFRQTGKLAIDKSQYKFEFAPNGYLAALSAEESISGEGELLGGVVSTTSMTLRARPATDKPKERHIGTEEQLSALARVTLFGSARRPGPMPEVDWARAGNKTFSELVEEAMALPSYEETHSATRAERRQMDENFVRFAARFRIDPDSIDDALEAIEDGSPVSRRLWDAFGAAGTPRAQSALRQVIDMPQWTWSERRSQMIALSMTKYPTPETVNFLVSRFDDPEQGIQARYGLGTAVHNLAKVDRAAGEEAFGHLRNAVTDSTDRYEQADLLRAVGNAGHEDGLELARPHLSSEDDMVRAAATDSLRRAPQEEASKLLDQIVRNDPSPMVRDNAVHAIADRGVSEWSVGVLAHVARNDASEPVRRDALAALVHFSSEAPWVAKVVEQIVADAAQT